MSLIGPLQGIVSSARIINVGWPCQDGGDISAFRGPSTAREGCWSRRFLRRAVSRLGSLSSAANVGLSCLIGFGRTRSAAEYLGVAAQLNRQLSYWLVPVLRGIRFSEKSGYEKKAGRPARILSDCAGRFVVPGRKSWFGGSVRKLLGSWHALVSGCIGNVNSQTGALRSRAAMAIAARC